MAYRRLPIVVKAFQYNGTLTDKFGKFNIPFWAIDAYNTKILFYDNNSELFVHSLEGTLRVQQGNWIIKGIKGELYSCDPEIFTLTYEEV